MKRRDFLRTAGAAAALPVLPLPVMAAPVAAAPVNTMQVGWAALYARVNNRATPALIQKWLRVTPSQAQSLMSELVKRQIVHTPIAGSAAAIDPMYAGNTMNGLFGRAPKAVKQTQDLLEKLSDRLPDTTSDDETFADPVEVPQDTELQTPKEPTDETS